MKRHMWRRALVTLVLLAPLQLIGWSGSASASVNVAQVCPPCPLVESMVECDGGACGPEKIWLVAVKVKQASMSNMRASTSYIHKHFYYETGTAAWSVAAVRPQPAPSVALRIANYDLSIYRDKWINQTGTSALSGNQVEFVAIDSNSGRMPLGKHYAHVPLSDGFDDGFIIHVGQGSNLLARGTAQAISMGADDVVAVRDAALIGGQRYTFSLQAPVSSVVGLWIMGSTAGDPASYVRTRAQALAGTGGGSSANVSFTAPATGRYGVVVVNMSGSGTYRLSFS